MNDYWAKAIAAAGTARVALQLGDGDGAISRAYYAMFDAARAALEAIDPELAEAKSHTGIIGRFGQHVLIGRGLDRELGRMLNTAEDLRIAADYDRKPVAMEEARITIERMERFLVAVEAFLGEQTQ